MTSMPRLRLPKPQVAAMAATCLSILLLAGCAAPDAPAEELAALPAGEVPASWETVTIDDWAQFSVPEGWTAGRHPDYTDDATERFLSDANGKRRIAVKIETTDNDYSLVECFPTSLWFEYLDTTPLPEAHAGEDLALSTRIEEGATEEGEAAYHVFSSIYQQDRMKDGCGPETLVLPKELPGTLYWVVANEESGALLFSTKEEAEAYTQTDEYWTNKKVLESFRFVG